MPEQAFALKKNRRGTSPVSKISDNEDATAPLWYSEVLSVKNPVGEPIPEFCQPSEEGAKRPSIIRRQDTGDILPNDPAWLRSRSQAKELKCEVPSIASNSRAKSGDGKVLAGGPPGGCRC